MEPATFVMASPFASAQAPVPGTRVCVIVPVRNEAEHMQQTLDALRQQTDAQHRPLSPGLYEVLVLVNNSTDASYQVAALYQRQFPDFKLHIADITLSAEQANIGTVRRILMDEAYNRLTSAGNENGIIASTDGDTIADRQWIYHIMAEIAEGNDAVGGRILTRGHTGHARRHHLRDVTYRCLLARAETLMDPQEHYPAPQHFQYFGASLAVTCRMYKQAGRLPQVPHLEDMAFHQALLQQDARISKSFKVKVYTSARMQGRVSVGFSEQLKKWAEEHEANIDQTVEPVNYSLLLLGIRGRLRRCWQQYKASHVVQQPELVMLAGFTNISTLRLNLMLTGAEYFGKLWHEVEQLLQARYEPLRSRPQYITEAIAQLRALVSSNATASPADQACNWAVADEAAA